MLRFASHGMKNVKLRLISWMKCYAHIRYYNFLRWENGSKLELTVAIPQWVEYFYKLVHTYFIHCVIAG